MQKKLPLNRFLVFISMLINKNVTVEEITLECRHENDLNTLRKMSWLLFIKAIQERLVKIKINNVNKLINHDDINKLLFSNSSLREIEINENILNGNKEYSRILQYIFSSVRYLNEFTVYVNYLNPDFFEDKYKINVEIDTLILNACPSSNSSREISDNISHFIKNAYLLKTESIVIDFGYGDRGQIYQIFRKQSKQDLERISECKMRIKKAIHNIYDLSKNVLNTVKKITIKTEIEYKEIELALKNSKNKKIDKILKIYFNSFHNIYIYNPETSKLRNLYNLHDLKHGMFEIKFESKKNSLDKEDCTKLFNILYNNPEFLRGIEINYDTETLKNKDNLTTDQENDISYKIYNQIQEEYSKFKTHFTHSKIMKIHE